MEKCISSNGSDVANLKPGKHSYVLGVDGNSNYGDHS